MNEKRESMNMILGIDTGGTYTDGVLLDHETKKVIASAKAFTTKEDLTIGIESCIDRLQKEACGDICLVSLSTTLATNAVVEKKNIPVGLITIGASKEETYPATVTAAVSGKLDVMGREIMPVMENEVREALEKMAGKVEALAVSGYASVRNPHQELLVCDMAKEILDVPVVCAYELTSSLGFYERTVTAALNARLIPIIRDLILRTKSVLKKKNIHAPVIIVKGDGHLMTDSFAEENPVETILSGPAASAVGGRFLTGLKDAIVVDMGGTTTDIVFLSKGEVSVKKEGATVGGWQTRVRAVDVRSYGFGGDSCMKIDAEGRIMFEPYRAIPLCVETQRSPWLCDEIQMFHRKGYVPVKRMETDCFKIFRKELPLGHAVSQSQKDILRLLEDGPHSALYLADRMGTDIDSLPVEEMMEAELVQLISMTPTDILHALGEFRQWNHKASVMGMKLYAEATEKDYRDFLKEAEESCVRKLCRIIMRSVLEMDGLNAEKCSDDMISFIIDSLMGCGKNENLRCESSFIKPIVGIGAPACSWVRKAAQMLNTQYILPEYDSVANAVGAAVSDVRESVEAYIYRDHHIGKYVAFLPSRKESFETLREAKMYCRHDVRSCAELLAKRLAIVCPDVVLTEKDEYAENKCDGKQIFMKTIIRAEISGDTDFGKCSGNKKQS